MEERSSTGSSPFSISVGATLLPAMLFWAAGVRIETSRARESGEDLAMIFMGAPMLLAPLVFLIAIFAAKRRPRRARLAALLAATSTFGVGTALLLLVSRVL